jgi:uncharacterized alkaline shock family protein YloU
MILFFAGLFLLGVFGVLYSFDLAGYRLSDLPQQLNLPGIYSGVESAVTGMEEGNPSSVAIIVLVAMLLVGIILLLAELKPPTPRKVKLDGGTYATRTAIRKEAERAAMQDPDVLDSSARVQARRGTGARVELEAKVRRGEDLRAIRERVRERVRQTLQSGAGVDLRRLKIRLNEIDPREGKVRVK